MKRPPFATRRSRRRLAPLVALVLAAAAAATAAGCGRFELAGSDKPRDVPYVPTADVVVDEMLALAKVAGDDFLVDLGSGDGRIPIAAARRFGTRGLGVEIDPALVALSRRNALSAGVADKVAFEERDLFKTDLRPATVVTMYLLPAVNLLLRPRLLAELRPGARVVSHNYDMGDWRPDASMTLRHAETFGPVESRVHLWIVPAAVDGQWELRLDDDSRGAAARPYVLDLRQRYQEVAGDATGGDGERALRVANARLEGDRIGFALLSGVGDAAVVRRFAGRILGVGAGADELARAMEGSSTPGPAAAPGARAAAWRATRTAP